MHRNRNRWIANIVTFASLAGALALAPAGVAYAQKGITAEANREHGHREGLVAAALELGTLTPEQRTAIEQLTQTRHAAEVPVHQADAQVLTLLARQVEQAAIDKQALGPAVSARQTAALAARTVDMETAQKLHDVLTPAQRNALVDAIEAHFNRGEHAKGDGRGEGRGGHLDAIAKKLGLTDQQKAQIMANLRGERQVEGSATHDHRGDRKAWLESFRGDTFNASASASNGSERMERRAHRIEDLLVAAVPVLSPSQRAQLATHLRERAAHESHS